MESKIYNILKTIEHGNVIYSRLLGKNEKEIDSSLLDENHKIVKFRSLHGEEITIYQRKISADNTKICQKTA